MMKKAEEFADKYKAEFWSTSSKTGTHRVSGAWDALKQVCTESVGQTESWWGMQGVNSWFGGVLCGDH